MKKPISLLLALLASAALLLPAFAAGEHTHAGTLESLCTEPDRSIPCCGVFRCGACGRTYRASVTAAQAGLPVVKLEGSLRGISKEDRVTVRASYDDGCGVSFTSEASLNWQGASSLGYPKKNYTIRFLKNSGAENDVELRPAWGAQSRYCLKANWVDQSAARNIVSAKLWGEIVHDACLDDELDPLVNGGAVDGFPVLLYLNGALQGLYTLNTPKDRWIFGMTGKSKREGLLFSAYRTRSTVLEMPIADASDPEASGWEVEYCAAADRGKGSGALIDGMNRLIGFLNENRGGALRAGLGEYLNVDRAIDYMLFTFFICAGDNVYENAVWATWDGVRYSPSVYDLDSTWGLSFWDAAFPDMIPAWSSFDILRENALFRCLLDAYPEEVGARYVRLRENVLSYRNIERQFASFIGGIPSYAYAAEAALWPDAPSRAQNNLTQILQFAGRRIQSLDTLFGVTVEEKPALAWRAVFACENGAKVFVCPPQGTAGEQTRAASAYSVNAETGALTKTGGEIVFSVVLPDGGDALAEVVSGQGDAVLAGPEETGSPNLFRISDIAGDLTVRVRPAVGTAPLRERVLALWPVAAVLAAAGAVLFIAYAARKRKAERG